MAMHNIMAGVSQRAKRKLWSQILKSTTVDSIKSMIGHSLSIFKIIDGTKIDIQRDPTNIED
jgi:hypothetical protein